MAERTIGQVLRSARDDLNLSVSDAYHALKTHRRYIRALENDAFEMIPGEHQARKLLARYAEFLELDVATILEAFDSNGRLMVYEVGPKDSRHTRSFYKQKRRRPRQSYLPFLILMLLSFSILSVAVYMIWTYQTSQKLSKEESVDYRVSTVSPSSETIETSTEQTSDLKESDRSDALPLEITLSPADNPTVIEVGQVPDKVELTLSVKDSESWVAVSGTELAEGTTLSAHQEAVTVSVDKTLTPSVVLSLGAVEGLSLTINGQLVDLSTVKSQPATLTVHFK